MSRKSKKEDEEDSDLPPPPDMDSLLDSGEEKSDMDKVLQHMMLDENVDHNTELNGEEITAFQTLGMIAEGYEGLEVLEDWLLRGKRLRVSRQRKGRGEVVRITSRNVQMGNEAEKGGFFQRLKGGW